MISKAEQYRCYGAKVWLPRSRLLAKKKRPNCLKSPKLGSNSPTNEIKAEPTAATKLMDVRNWHLADMASAPHMSAFGGKADMTFCMHMSAFDPKRTWRVPYRDSF